MCNRQRRQAALLRTTGSFVSVLLELD